MQISRPLPLDMAAASTAVTTMPARTGDMVAETVVAKMLPESAPGFRMLPTTPMEEAMVPMNMVMMPPQMQPQRAVFTSLADW